MLKAIRMQFSILRIFFCGEAKFTKDAPRRHQGGTREAHMRHQGGIYRYTNLQTDANHGGTREAPRRHQGGTKEAPMRQRETTD